MSPQVTARAMAGFPPAPGIHIGIPVAATHCDALCLILLLFRLKGELDEELLQFLVAIIDAELLKAARKTWQFEGGHGQEQSTEPQRSRGTTEQDLEWLRGRRAPGTDLLCWNTSKP